MLRPTLSLSYPIKLLTALGVQVDRHLRQARSHPGLPARC